MLDFLIISTRPTKRGVIEIYPRFRLYPESSDLMIRGGDFYAVWNEERGLWSTKENDALLLIDRELDRYAEENSHKFDGNVKVLHMWDSESGMVDAWHKYCQFTKYTWLFVNLPKLHPRGGSIFRMKSPYEGKKKNQCRRLRTDDPSTLTIM